MKKVSSVVMLLCLAGSLLMVGEARAAEEWEYILAPYLWGAGLDGDVGIGPVTTGVEADFGDIVENLDGGVLAHFEASKGRWTILGDLIFLDLGADTPRFMTSTDYEQTILEAGAAYAVKDDFEVLFGARLSDVDAEIDVFGFGVGIAPVVRVEGSKSWVDPFLGVRWSPRINDRWGFQGRVDAGGFGVGSDLTWNAVATVLFDVSERVTLGLGYRLMDVDFEETSGRRFVYDVEMGGALIGLGFRF